MFGAGTAGGGGGAKAMALGLTNSPGYSPLRPSVPTGSPFALKTDMRSLPVSATASRSPDGDQAADCGELSRTPSEAFWPHRSMNVPYSPTTQTLLFEKSTAATRPPAGEYAVDAGE